MSKTPISTLQEYMAKQNKSLPEYVLVSQTAGTNLPSFTIKVLCNDKVAHGSASNKKEAKHNAAKEMLKLLNCNANCNKSVSGKQSLSTVADSYYTPGFCNAQNDADTFVNSIGKLGEYCISNGFKTPQYSDSGMTGPDHKRCFKIKCSVGSLSIIGEGNTKKDAKQKAAQSMHETLIRSTTSKNNMDLRVSASYPNLIDAVEQRLESIKILDLKKTELSIPLAQSHKKALEMYSQLRSKKPIRSMKHIEIKDYHEMLKNLVTPNIRQSVQKLLMNVTEFTKETVLKKVTDLLDVDYEYKYAVKYNGQYAVCCSLNTNPPMSDVGVGKTYDEAKDKAITNTLHTINIFLD